MKKTTKKRASSRRKVASKKAEEAVEQGRSSSHTGRSARQKKGAYGTGCLNRECKLRRHGCAGFQGCPGYRGV